MQKKAFDKIHPFMLKILIKAGIERTYLNKDCLWQTHTNIILSSEKLNSFHRCFSHLDFYSIWDLFLYEMYVWDGGI